MKQATKARSLGAGSKPRPGILITGVNPFEDVPGYHFYSMLVDDQRFRVEVGDDSAAATALIRSTGTEAHSLEHPGPHLEAFVEAVQGICDDREIHLLVPGADAHLFAFTQSPPLAARCPAAMWLARNQIRNKWDLQNWISSYLPTPRRQRVPEDLSELRAAIAGQWPIVVKGLIKGASSCDSMDEVTATIRTLLKNPANQGSQGGVYLEQEIEGEEYCALILKLNEPAPFILCIRKLATSEAGTTLAATVDHSIHDGLGLERIADQLSAGMAIELELRRDRHGNLVAFEGNVRFPSWISALENLGPRALAASLHAQLGVSTAMDLEVPPEGVLIYRLPQSGYLSPDRAFSREPKQRGGLLWPWATPHQFRVK